PSQKCSGGGREGWKGVSVRWHPGPDADCGVSLHRDHHGAKHLLAVGKKAVGGGTPLRRSAAGRGGLLLSGGSAQGPSGFSPVACQTDSVASTRVPCGRLHRPRSLLTQARKVPAGPPGARLPHALVGTNALGGP